MNCPLISIIVPVYQVEKYLEKCINSIIAQTYRNLEIILVDDGSTDDCPAICNRFQSQDSRIKVIHQENGGLSHARNIGLQVATGDFIGFVDSDDWIEPNMYEVLLSTLQKTGTDIAVCDRQIEIDDSPEKPIILKYLEEKIYFNEDVLKIIINGGDNIIRDTVWNKLYKRSIISNITFLENKIHEDVLWTPRIIGNSRCLVCINYPLYHYLQRHESLTHNNQLLIKRIFDKIEILENRINYIHEHYQNLERLVIFHFQNVCCSEYINFCLKYLHLDGSGKIRHELHRHFCQSSVIIFLDYDNFFTAIGRFLFRFSPCLFMLIYKLIQKLYFCKTSK